MYLKKKLIILVIPGAYETCLQDSSITAPAGNGYISSLVSDQTGCGSTDTPWVIQAAKGQVIEVTLLDFALTQNMSSTATRGPHCHVYVIFKVQTCTNMYKLVQTCTNMYTLVHVAAINMGLIISSFKY